MVKLEEHKHSTENKAIERMPLPDKVYVPLSQHIGKACSPEAKIGDTVLTGQKIGSAQTHVFAPVHSSISGKVISVQEWPHPLLGRAAVVVIENDKLNKLVSPQVTRPQEEIDRLSADEIRRAVFEAGVVGMGGASFPTHIKLTPPEPVDTLIINGAECEPYLNCDNRLMIERTKEIIAGIALIARCVAAKNIYIAIEENKLEAIKNFRAQEGGLTIKVIGSAYPQGGEKQLIKNILKREVPSGKLPFAVGVVVHNVATVYAIYEAVYLGKPLYERVVTVTGDCLENPSNLLVRIGTPIRELIARCGPLVKQPQKIICGGPMMGIAQYSQDVPVIKATCGIILLSESAVKPMQDEFCIRCGRCVEYCPVGLLPCLITIAAEKEKWDLAKAYGCLECMECGLCSYVCPQKRNMLQKLKDAKARVAR
ncbi:MAG: electron transport complex subunit RsxC [Candidatus Omnitrophica bacterium]|nr:electron transport complex subunit RsxC [Candidatus Omnitrophota bacterium]